jgi:hypothetical protein
VRERPRDRALSPLWAIIVLGVLVRIAIVAARGDVNLEVFEYDTIARNVLAGDGYVFRHRAADFWAFYSGFPYVLLLAAGYAVSGGSMLAAVVLQSASSAGLTAVSFAITRRLGAGVTAAALAAALVDFHPGLVLYDTHKIHSLSFDALAIALSVLALLRLRERMTAGAALAAGLAFGVAFVQRATMLLAPAVAIVWLGLAVARPRARLIRVVLVAGVGTLLVVGPWVVRNWIVLGTPILSSTGAEALWRGNAPQGLGGSYTMSGRTLLEEDPALRAALRDRGELEQARIFRETAMTRMASAPVATFERVLHKLLIFWSFGPVSGALYPAAYLYLYGAYYALVLALAGVGASAVILARVRDPEPMAGVILVVAVAVSVSLVQSVFYVEVRHRWGVEPLVLTVAGVGAARIWTLVRGTVAGRRSAAVSG